jgi:hypothetical protein
MIVGAMKDQKRKMMNLHASHTLGIGVGSEEKKEKKTFSILMMNS